MVLSCTDLDFMVEMHNLDFTCAPSVDLFIGMRASEDKSSKAAFAPH